MKKVAISKRTSKNGYVSQLSHYQAQNCQGCPLRGSCHKGQGNRRIQVNHPLQKYRQKAKDKLNSQEGLIHQSRRPIEPEAVFGQLKKNNSFNRFTFKGLAKVSSEFALQAIGHNLRKWHRKKQIEADTGPDPTILKSLILFFALWFRNRPQLKYRYC